MTIRLRVKELAEERGETAGSLARKTGLGITSVRRYWHGTGTGTQKGAPLTSADFDALEALADALGVEPGELIVRDRKRSEPSQ